MIHSKQCLVGICSLQVTSIADRYGKTVPFILCISKNCQSINLQDRLNKQKCFSSVSQEKMLQQILPDMSVGSHAIILLCS